MASDSNCSNPYRPSRADEGDQPSALPDKHRSLQLYWNPLMASVAMLTFYIPFVVLELADKANGIKYFRSLYPLAVIGMLMLLLTWVIGVGQAIVTVVAFVRQSKHWKHHLLATVWVVGYFLIWNYLASKGCYLTA